jgi:hypothetical protein
MAMLTPKRAGAQKVEWLHWLYIRGNRAMSCDVEVRGDGLYSLTLLPLWSHEDRIVETFVRPADALRRHTELTRELQESGWLLVEGRPVTNAA